MTDGSIRFLAGLSLAALAAITGIISYLHALAVVYRRRRKPPHGHRRPMPAPGGHVG